MFANTLEKTGHFLLRFDTSLFARHSIMTVTQTVTYKGPLVMAITTRDHDLRTSPELY